jgi:hypothetical protein
MILSLKFAEHCAARAAYLYAGARQIAHVGIDPTFEHGPQLFGAVGRRSYRVTVPHLSWRAVMRANYHPIVLKLYQAQESIRFRLDWRYRRWPGAS